MQKEQKFGLSNENINLIVILVIILLLLLGPIEPYGMFFRISYLIVIPVLLRYGLMNFGKSVGMDKHSNNRLTRAIYAGVAGILLVSAFSSYNAKYHTECDQYVQTRDGLECVGDYVTVKGSDKSGVVMKIMLSGFAMWLAVSKKSTDEQTS